MPKLSLMVLMPPLIFLALVALFAFGMLRDDPEALPSTLVGRAAPPLEPAPLASYPSFGSEVMADGQVKLVNFWASWCAPCRAEHPTLMKLAALLPVYGVNKSDPENDASKFLNDLGNPFTAIISDRNGRQSLEWGVYGLPETFVVDGDGTVLLRFAGALTSRRLADTVGPVLEEAGVALPDGLVPAE